MFDLAWSELALIIAVAVLVIGPKEIPQVMYGLGRVMKRMQYMRFAMSHQFEQFMQEQGVKDIGGNVNFEAPDVEEDGKDEPELLNQDPLI